MRDLPPVFKWLAETGGTSEPEMLKTFNCGIGMILVVNEAQVDEISGLLTETGERVARIGKVNAGGTMTYRGALL